MDTPRSLMYDLLTFRASDAKRMWRENIFARDGYACTYCGSSHNLTIDHIHPRSKGGDRWSASNCTTACRCCNRAKGSMSVEEFLSTRVA
ncbi:HNH endonuclease [Synechococcus phage Syn5]|uniref:HNH endonuclease n=1 Tax=Synechococcus phage Syn5 TaxID=2914003 RepID=A4ZRD2_9CAUD|nr:HNH endonuclease [Synechococcus phage Syn5]ABP87958.1 HNH endonuclease [Synechococcus phage Syn5]